MAHPRREFIPAMPTEVRAHLQRVEGTYEGRRIIYRCSEGSGRSLKEAVLLDGYNAVSGPRRERHWLAQHHPGASFEPGRTFDAQGRVYRLYQVTPPEGAVFTIFFDATYYDDLF